MSNVSRGEARRNFLLGRLNVAAGRGVEIGALNRPIISKAEGDIRYVDFADSDSLRTLYSKVDSVNIDDIVSVDYVWAPGKKLEDLVGRECIDYVIASHVVEHTPNLVSWLQQLTACLRNGGVISLIIPDKRFTFDRDRNLTSMGEVIGAYISKCDRPSAAQVFDHLAYHVQNTTGGTWRRVHTVQEAFDTSFTIHSTREYFDVHCTIVTPASMLDLMECIFRIGLLPLVVDDFAPTHANEIDFFIVLRKVEASNANELLLMQIESLAQARARLA